MIIFRFLGSLMLLIAVIALTADLSRPRKPGAPTLASIERHWSDFAPQSYASLQKTVKTRAHPMLWDPVLRSVFGLPAALSLGALAAGLLYVGRRRRRVEIFVN